MANLNRKACLLISIVALAAFLQGARGGDDLFLIDKPSTSFDRFVGWVQSSKEIDGSEQMLKVLYFQGGSQLFSDQFLVSTSGVASSRFVGPTSASGDGKSYQLSGEQLQNLRASLRILPPSVVGPSLRRLICIGFKDPSDPNKWIAKTYDILNMPESLKKALRITDYPKRTGFAKEMEQRGWSVP
jgi:hypothetical protein